MIKNNKRILSLLIAILMVTSLAMPSAVFAEEFDEEVFEEPYEEVTYSEEPAEDQNTEESEVFVNEEYTDEDSMEEESLDEELANGVLVDEELTDKILIEEVLQEETHDITENIIVNSASVEEAALNEPTDAIVITKQPQNANVEVKQTAQFSVEATGEGLTYLWEYKNAGSNEWVAWTTKKTATIAVAYSSTRNGMMLRCVITDANNNTKTTDEVTLTYGEVEPTDAIVITKQPQNANVEVKQTAQFSVEASGENLTYLWQYKYVGSDEWVNWATKKTAEIAVAYNANRDGMSLRCMITDGKGNTAYSAEAVMTYIKESANSITIASVVDKNNADTTSNIGPDGLLITFTVNTSEENTKVRLLVSNDGTFTDEWYPMDKNTSEVNGVPTQYVFAPGLKLYLKAQLLDQNGNVLATQTTATEAEPRPFNEESPYNQDGHVLDFNNKGVAFVQVRGPYPPYYVVKVSATGTYSLATRGTGQPGIHNAKGQKLEITNGSFVITDNDIGNLFIQAFDIGEFSLTAPGYYTDADNALTYAVNGTAQTVSVTSFHAPNATTVYVPAEVSVNGQNYQVTAIGPEAFMDNTVITTADLPNSITVIGARAFKGCTSLSQMTTHS